MQRLATDAKSLREDSKDVIERLRQLESSRAPQLSYPPAPLPASSQFRDVIHDGESAGVRRRCSGHFFGLAALLVPRQRGFPCGKKASLAPTAR